MLDGAESDDTEPPGAGPNGAEPNGAGSTVLRDAAGAGTVVLRLNRPAVRNALDSALVDRLLVTLAELDDDPDVRAVILAGTPPGFCAGSDLTELAGLAVTERIRHEARAGQLARLLARLSFPVLAAVEGFAMGGGFLLATSCDIVVSAAEARWQLPEVGLGWVPPWGLQSLVSRAGPAAARRLAWGAEPLTGRQLHRLGAVDEICEAGQAVRRATELAARLAVLPPHAVASTKRALADAGTGPAEALDSRTSWMFGLDCSSEAARRSFARYAREDRDPGR